MQKLSHHLLFKQSLKHSPLKRGAYFWNVNSGTIWTRNKLTFSILLIKIENTDFDQSKIKDQQVIFNQINRSLYFYISVLSQSTHMQTHNFFGSIKTFLRWLLVISSTHLLIVQITLHFHFSDRVVNTNTIFLSHFAANLSAIFGLCFEKCQFVFSLFSQRPS